MKRVVTAGLLVCLTLGLTMMSGFAPFAAAAEKTRDQVRIPILTLPLGAGVYEWWASYERIFEANHPWLRVSAQETPGFVYNFKEMANNKARWKTTIFGTDDTVKVAAENAIAPYFDKRVDFKPFKYLFPLNGCAMSTWLWATLDPKIKSMKDFEGKRIGLGFRAQIAWGTRPTSALETLGVKAKLEFLGPIPSVEALLDNRVDAAQVQTFLEVKTPEATIAARPLQTLQQLLAARRPFHYVDYGKDWPALMQQQKGYTVGTPVEIPAGTLPNQDTNLVGIQTEPDGWSVHESFPEDLAYEFTKFMIQHGRKLAKYTETGEYFFIPKGFVQKFGYTEENVHPGAVRAYKEAGLWN